MPAVKVQCVACRHSCQPKTKEPNDRHMLRAGFASCALKDSPGVWLSVLWPRSCKDFQQSPDEETRRNWLKR